MNIGSLTASLGVSTKGLERAATAMKGFQRSVATSSKKINASLKSTGDSMKQVGKTAAKNITIPMTLAATAAVKLFSDFEASISKVVGLVGVAASTTDKWAKDIIKIAPQVAKAPAELADALFFVTSAGIRGAEAMDVLTISAKASAAGLGETKVVADLVTSAMNAYGPAMLNAQQATDVLVTAVKEGKAEAPELAASLGQVLPIASAMAVSFNEVGAAVAAMTRTGTNAATASTQLRQILNSLLKPTKSSEEALRAMGTSAAGLRKTIREEGLLKALLDIDKLTKKFGEETVAKVFPNIRALSGVLDLMGKNVADNVKIFDSLNDSTGALNKAFEVASDTFKFKFNTAVAAGKAALTTLGESIAVAMLPVLRRLSEFLVNLTRWFSGLTDSQKRWIVSIGALVAALGPLLIVLGFLVGNVLPGLVIASKAASLALFGLKLAIVTNPIGVVITALTALVGLFLIFKRRSNDAAESQKNFNKQLEETEAISNRGRINKFLREMGVLQNELISTPGGLSFEIEGVNTAALGNLSKELGNIPLSFLRGIQSLLSTQIVDIKRQLELTKAGGDDLINQVQVAKIANRMKLLQATLVTINKELERGSKIKPLGGEDGIVPPAIVEALGKLATGSKLITNLNKALGNSFDDVEAKTSLYTEVLTDLITAGVDPANASIRNLASRIRSLEFQEAVKPLKEITVNLLKMAKAQERIEFAFKQKKGIIDSNALFTASENLTLVTNKLDDMSHITIAAKGAMDKLTDPTLFQVMGNVVGSVFDGMANSISNALNSTENIFKAFGKFFANFIKGMIIKLVAATVAALALVVVLSFIPGFGGVGAFEGIKAATGFGSKFKAALGAVGGAGLADGGIVPPGFPNDSFNARLTSNEAVIPLDRLPQIMGMRAGRGGDQRVEFILEGRTLKATMDKENELSGIF